MLITDSFSERSKNYTNTFENNNKIHQDFSEALQSISWLAEHRKFIVTNELGFGDNAFHYMWYLLVQHITEHFNNHKILEIGIYKGQIISLLLLISTQLNSSLEITGISPLQGNPSPRSKWLKLLKLLTSTKFRRNWKSGNFYPEEDYRTVIENLFKVFELDFSQISIIEGYSNDPKVLKTIETENFALIYIDGDHTFEVVKQDIENYSSHIINNGFLVMDDASYYLPGNNFFKGHESVSRACEIIPSLGFTNVLNVGHNRIYQKIG
jgi:Methyltransferase domain